MRLFKRLLLVALLFSFVPTFAQHKSSATTKKKVKQLQSDLTSVKSRRKQVVKKLSTTKRQVNRVSGDIQELDSQIDVLEGKLQDTTEQLDTGKMTQFRLTLELEERTKQLDEKREQVRRRLRAMYIHNNASTVPALLRSRDTSDLASRAYLVGRIAKADRELFDEYVVLRDEVIEKKKEQDKIVKRVAQLKARQEDQQNEMQGIREVKSEVLQDLQRTQDDLERIVTQLDAEENLLEERIADYYDNEGRDSGLEFTGNFIRPVPGPIVSGFGMRMHPILHRRRMHTGLDMAAHSGTPIKAAARGIVIAATYTRGYGNMVILDHGSGISTLYGHCSAIYVSEGDRVEQGERIAAVGSTGLSTGPHLHWEIRVHGKPINPRSRL
jgi:murein DD-endopeptidase MepM/ murein hydrolase activator NlpD